MAIKILPLGLSDDQIHVIIVYIYLHVGDYFTYQSNDTVKIYKPEYALHILLLYGF